MDVSQYGRLPPRFLSRGVGLFLLLGTGTNLYAADPITLDSQSRTITAIVDADTDTDTSLLDGLYSNTVTAFSSPTTMTAIQSTTLTIDGSGGTLSLLGSGSVNGVRPSNPGDPGVLDGSLSSATFTFTVTETVMWSLDFDYTIDDNSNQADPAVSYSLTGTTSGSFTTDGSGTVSESGSLLTGTYTFTIDATADGKIPNAGASPALALWENLDFEVVAVPEPGSGLLTLMALALLRGGRRRSRAVFSRLEGRATQGIA